MSFREDSGHKRRYIKQLRSMCTAKLFIAQHGSGIIHSIWSRRQIYVVELPPMNYNWPNMLLSAHEM